MKKDGKHRKEKTIVQDYTKVFSPPPLPCQGAYTDEGSLEQPSALKYFPSTTTPAAGMSIGRQKRRNTKLE